MGKSFSKKNYNKDRASSYKQKKNRMKEESSKEMLRNYKNIKTNELD